MKVKELLSKLSKVDEEDKIIISFKENPEDNDYKFKTLDLVNTDETDVIFICK